VRTLRATNNLLEIQMPASKQYQAKLEAYTERKDPVAMQSDAELIGGLPEQVLRQD